MIYDAKYAYRYYLYFIIAILKAFHRPSDIHSMHNARNYAEKDYISIHRTQFQFQLIKINIHKSELMQIFFLYYTFL